MRRNTHTHNRTNLISVATPNTTYIGVSIQTILLASLMRFFLVLQIINNEL